MSNLTAINAALNKGALIDDSLQIVEKYSLKWVWLKITTALAMPFHRCFGCQDPWAHYRIDKVANAIITRYISSTETELLKSILTTLQTKAIRSTNKSVYGAAIEHCFERFEPPMKQTEVLAVSKAIDALGDNLYLKIGADNPKSFAISPVSIAIVIGMLLKASPLDKQIEFLEKLHLKQLRPFRFHQALDKIIKDAGDAFRLAQAIIHKNLKIDDSFLLFMKTHYDAPSFSSLDAIKLLNNWVASKTNDKITKLLEEDAQFRLALVNAIYLNLEWKYAFSGPFEKETFTFADREEDVVMMQQRLKNPVLFLGKNHSSFDMLELPYRSPAGHKFSQLIFLPKRVKDFEEMETALTLEKVTHCRQQKEKNIDVILKLPKFKTEASFSLKEHLQKLGLTFELDPTLIKEELPVLDIVHKTFVENDEKGTTAAAATAAKLTFSANHKPTHNFFVNRPYVYMIMDGDQILFKGRVKNREGIS